MRNKIIFGVCAFLFSIGLISRVYPADLGESGGRVFTLSDSINTAFLNNKYIQIQEEELKYAKADINYAISKFLPLINMGYSYTYNDAVLNYGSLDEHSRKDPRIWTGYINENIFSLQANETVYNGGANIATLRQSKVAYRIQSETLRATKLDVEFETKRLFNGILLAYETLRIAEELVDQARAHYDNVLSKYNNGTSSKFDLLQSKVQIATLMPQLVKAQNAVDLIIVEFKKAIGVNMLDPVMIRGELKWEDMPIIESRFLKEAYSKNPNMALKLLGIDLRRWGVELAKAGWLPQITTSASYTFTSGNVNDMFNPRHDLWDVGVKASIAIFDGFATKAKVDMARAQYSRAWIEKDNIMDQLIVDVRDACVNMKQAKAIILSQEESIVEAKEALRLANVRYDNGVGINLDVFDAEVSLAQVQQNLAEGIYDYVVAKAELDRIMGASFQEEGVK